jgi:hypothetical protein
VTLKHTRWCLLKRPGNLTTKQTGLLRGLLRLNLRTDRAYLGCSTDRKGREQQPAKFFSAACVEPQLHTEAERASSDGSDPWQWATT